MAGTSGKAVFRTKTDLYLFNPAKLSLKNIVTAAAPQMNINNSRNMVLLVSLKFLYVILRVPMARKKDTIKNVNDKSANRPVEAITK